MPQSQRVLTVVTGPERVDVGPVAAHLGRNLGDGLAVRIARTERVRNREHTSPDPHHRHTLDPATCNGTGGDTCSMNDVGLWVLPSAWQNPDTNLGVAFDGEKPSRDLAFDLDTLGKLGISLAHRVTVHRAGAAPSGWRAPDSVVPHPVEFGDLAVHARDSIWRGADDAASRQVLIEAGDGRTFLSALDAVGIPPWSPHIDRLDLWIVVDCAQAGQILDHGDGDGDGLMRSVPELVVQAVETSGGAVGSWRHPAVTLRCALINVHTLIPGIAGVTGDLSGPFPERYLDPDGADAHRLYDMVGAIEEQAGVQAQIVGTGTHTFIDTTDEAAAIETAAAGGDFGDVIASGVRHTTD
jgi:hypothetical protein